MHLNCAMWCRIFITLVIACCCYQEEVAVRSHRSTADFCTLVQDLSSNTFRVYWHICRAFLYLINHLSVCCDVSKRGFVSRSLHYWWTLSGRPSYHHHFHLINFSHCLWPMINVWESWNTHFPPLPSHPLHPSHHPLHPPTIIFVTTTIILVIVI